MKINENRKAGVFIFQVEGILTSKINSKKVFYDSIVYQRQRHKFDHFKYGK